MEKQEDIPLFTFKPSKHFKRENIIKTKLSCDEHECFVLSNVFTKDECNQLIDQGEKAGFQSLSKSYSPKYRNNERIINLNPTLRNIMWERIESFIEDTLILGKTHETIHLTPLTEGTWKKYGLNERFRLCKYNPTNFFKSHYDEGYHPDPIALRTLKTCMVYLNEDFEGGETIFYMKGLKPIALKPKIGMCLIFNQKILHEGATVTKGLKYFIRNDIYYKRTTKRVIELMDSEKSAIELYKCGVNLENQGDSIGALNCYIKASKMCSDVADLYNHFAK